jgi:hypothetical protein
MTRSWKRGAKLPSKCPHCRSAKTFIYTSWPGRCGCYACCRTWDALDLTVSTSLKNPEAA